MDLSPYIESVRAGVVSASSLADEPTQHVAARLGLTPESLSRAFSRLKAVGVVIDASQVVIKDIAKLRQIAADERSAVRGTLRPMH